MRLILLLVLFPALAACTQVLPFGADREAAALFDQGLQELADSGRADTLESLQRQHPDSRWAWRAEALSQVLAGENRAREALSQQLRMADKQLAACRQESAECQRELEQVKQDLEELKRLVIETELRTRPSPGNKH